MEFTKIFVIELYQVGICDLNIELIFMAFYNIETEYWIKKVFECKSKLVGLKKERCLEAIKTCSSSLCF